MQFIDQQRKEWSKKWHQAIEDKSLQDLRYKMEQGKWGEVLSL